LKNALWGAQTATTMTKTEEEKSVDSAAKEESLVDLFRDDVLPAEECSDVRRAAVDPAPSSSLNNNTPSTGSEGPSFKDQTQTVVAAAEGGEAMNQARSAAVQGKATAHHHQSSPHNKSPEFGPAYKDQARPVALAEPEVDVHDERNVSANPDRSIIFADAQLVETTLPAAVSDRNNNVLPVHVVETDFGTTGDGNVDEVQASEGGLRVTKRTASVTAAIIALAIIAAFVGGYCGKGNCTSSDGDETSSLNNQPNEGDPTNTPSAAPIVSVSFPTATPKASEATVNFINTIKRGNETIVYPPPSNPKAEELAVQWLIEEDPLGLSVGTEENRSQLVQRYALLTLWFSSNGLSWGDSSAWLTFQNECTWFGVSCVKNVVSKIELDQNNLEGSLPADISLLTSLTSLRITVNTLRGRLPVKLAS